MLFHQQVNLGVPGCARRIRMGTWNNFMSPLVLAEKQIRSKYECVKLPVLYSDKSFMTTEILARSRTRDLL